MSHTAVIITVAYSIAVILGGASITGGSGSVLGTALGLILLAIIQNGLILLGVPSYWSQFSTGVVQ